MIPPMNLTYDEILERAESACKTAQNMPRDAMPYVAAFSVYHDVCRVMHGCEVPFGSVVEMVLGMQIPTYCVHEITAQEAARRTYVLLVPHDHTNG
jgi:hypothetical protein